MKRNCLVLIFLFMLLLTASAFALTADVTIKLDGRSPVANPGFWTGVENKVELYITNSAKLKGMSLGIRITSTDCEFSLVTPYGNVPEGSEFLQEEGVANNFLNSFGAGNLSATYAQITPLLAEYTMGGADASPGQTKNLFAHLTSTLGYTFKILAAPGLGGGTVTFSPFRFPPAGDWIMDGSTNIDLITGLPSGATNPDFMGVPTGSAGNPVGAAIFVCGPPPCTLPAFTSTPTLPVSANQGGFTFDFDATVGQVPPLSWSVDVGSINSNGVFTIPAVCPPGVTNVVVKAINGCPGPDNFTPFPFTITWTNATPVISNCAGIAATTGLGSTLVYDFNVTDDNAGGHVWSMLPVAGASIDPATGVLTYSPGAVGTFAFSVTVTDVCGASATCNFSIEVTSFNIVRIPKMGDGGEFVFQGTYTHVPVILSGSALELAGYSLLIYYDASALSFVSAEIGDPLKPCVLGGSGWEYFTYRFGAQGNCGGPCPSGLLSLTALAETNNGPNHPGCGGTMDPYELYGEIADLKFYVTNDRTYECQFVEIGFAWIDCSDNSFSDPTGNILYIAADKAVHTFEWDGLNLNANLVPCEPFPNMTGVIYGGFCVPDCEINPNKPVMENIYFWNGGIDIACADEIDARGDINLNGIANEVADAVLFTNFFIQGITAFYDVPYNATRVQGKVAATDVNADGHPLTVGDLVYLLRIIVGDALPILKLSPFATGATVNFADGIVSTESGSEIGAIYATFAIKGAYSVSNNTNMQIESNEVNGELKVLVFSGMDNLSNRIASGTNELFTVSGDVELKSVEVADYYGNMLSTRVNKISMPTSFALSQNVPNPFNPTTKIGFALPNQTQWSLSIYNVAGQLVKNFSGNNIGSVSVEWDASTVPSGVYFYKLNAGSYSDTKKMVLMK
jgi:hypothetical protein